jgi:hypothetical protein
METSPRLTFNCQEDWKTMTPDKGGKYCSSCNWVVRDFSGLSLQETNSILNSVKEEKVCGRFKKYQLNKPFNNWKDRLILLYQNLQFNYKNGVSKTLILFLFTMLLFSIGCHRQVLGYVSHPSKSKKGYMKKLKKDQRNKINEA